MMVHVTLNRLYPTDVQQAIGRNVQTFGREVVAFWVGGVERAQRGGQPRCKRRARRFPALEERRKWRKEKGKDKQ